MLLLLLLLLLPPLLDRHPRFLRHQRSWRSWPRAHAGHFLLLGLQRNNPAWLEALTAHPTAATVLVLAPKCTEVAVVVAVVMAAATRAVTVGMAMAMAVTEWTTPPVTVPPTRVARAFRLLDSWAVLSTPA